LQFFPQILSALISETSLARLAVAPAKRAGKAGLREDFFILKNNDFMDTR